MSVYATSQQVKKAYDYITACEGPFTRFVAYSRAARFAADHAAEPLVSNAVAEALFQCHENDEFESDS